MEERRRISLFVFLSLCLSQISVSSGSLNQVCFSAIVKQAKCQWAKVSNTNVNCTGLSPCFGSNQIVSDSTANQISSYCNQVSAALLSNTGRRKRSIYNFDTYPEKKWTSPIQYRFDATIVSDVHKNTIRGVLSYIQAQTCLTFTEINQPADTTTPYIQYSLSDGCASFTGRSTDFQYSSVYGSNDCLTKFGEMLYYTVQTLGLWHESQRPDSNLYVAVNLSNVNDQNQGDFAPVPAALQQTYGLPYGYESVMHFPGRIFSKNGGITLRTLDPLYQQTIGQRVQLSFLDSQTLNRAYCSGACSGVTLPAPCQNGGYQDPKNCGVCRCPDGFTGSACDVIESTVGEDICGGEVDVTDTEQTITSLGYAVPGSYPEGIGCTWYLKATSGRRITLQFVDEFGLHCENFACYHWVEVRYRGLLNNTGPRFCCTDRPTVVLTSDSSDVLVIFRSNQTGLPTSERRGFKIVFKLVADNTTCTCANGGTCVNGVCVCQPGYTGVNCSTVVTQPCDGVVCLNGGTCNAGVCTCPPGYMGANCGTVTGETGCVRGCMNGGTCVNGSCVCVVGFIGPACENTTTPSCDPACQNGGSCVNGACVCQPGYTGTTCQTVIPPTSCNPNPCRNNGTCSLSDSGQPQCACLTPFYGQNCELAPCGSCQSKPGLLQEKCQVIEDPTMTCSYTVTDDDWDCWCWVFFCSKTTKTRVVYFTCYEEQCCDNATEYNSRCGVTGWGDWSACSALCGGGQMIRYYYDNVLLPGSNKPTLQAVRNETSAPCNTQACECDGMDSKRCSFSYVNGVCMLPAPFTEYTYPYCYDQSSCKKKDKKPWWKFWG